MRVLASSTEADAALAVQRLLKLDNADEVFTKISKWTDKVDGPPRIYDDLPDACNSLVRLVNRTDSFDGSRLDKTGMFQGFIVPDNATAIGTIFEGLGTSNGQNLLTAMGRIHNPTPSTSIPAGAQRNADIYLMLSTRQSVLDPESGTIPDPHGFAGLLNGVFASLEEVHAYRMLHPGQIDGAQFDKVVELANVVRTKTLLNPNANIIRMDAIDPTTGPYPKTIAGFATTSDCIPDPKQRTHVEMLELLRLDIINSPYTPTTQSYIRIAQSNGDQATLVLSNGGSGTYPYSGNGFLTNRTFDFIVEFEIPTGPKVLDMSDGSACLIRDGIGYTDYAVFDIDLEEWVYYLP